MRRLTRSTREKMIGGVAGGLSEYFDVDPVVVRLIWVAATVLTGGLAVPAYLVMWWIMPEDPTAPTVQTDVGPAFTTTPTPATPPPAYESRVAGESTGYAAPPTSTVTGYGPPTGSDQPAFDPARADDAGRRQRAAGIVLVALGILFLSGQIGLFRWVDFRFIWPLVLVGLGVLLLARQNVWRR